MISLTYRGTATVPYSPAELGNLLAATRENSHALELREEPWTPRMLRAGMMTTHVPMGR
jgi:hypothetical protein